MARVCAQAYAEDQRQGGMFRDNYVPTQCLSLKVTQYTPEAKERLGFVTAGMLDDEKLKLFPVSPTGSAVTGSLQKKPKRRRKK